MKIKYFTIALLAVTALSLTSCFKDTDGENLTTGGLYLYPNGLSTNDDFAQDVLAEYKQVVGNLATVTLIKSTSDYDALCGYDYYQIRLAFSSSNYASMASAIYGHDFSGLKSLVPEGNWKCTSVTGYKGLQSTSIYAPDFYLLRNPLAGEWTGTYEGQTVKLSVKDERTETDNYFSTPYTLTYGQTSKTNTFDYDYKPANGSVKIVASESDPEKGFSFNANYTLDNKQNKKCWISNIAISSVVVVDSVALTKVVE